MSLKNLKPVWLIPKKKPKTSKMSTRNIVRKHLKEWNMDDDIRDLAKEEDIKEEKEYLKVEKEIQEYSDKLMRRRLKK